MKKVALITAAVGLLGLGAATGSNPNAKPAKEKQARTSMAQSGCCGGCCAKAKSH